MFTPELIERAAALIAACRARGLKIATAESCTGGLVAGLLTEIPGSSAVVERGFVVYSNQAKHELLGVPASTIASFGAVSEETARAMAQGAIAHARADFAVAITGIAGPDGGTAAKARRSGLFRLRAERTAKSSRSKSVTGRSAGAR